MLDTRDHSEAPRNAIDPRRQWVCFACLRKGLALNDKTGLLLPKVSGANPFKRYVGLTRFALLQIFLSFHFLFVGMPSSAICQELVVQNGNGAQATAMAATADGSLLATAENYRKRIVLWDMRSLRMLRTLSPDFDVTSLSFSRDGKILAAATTAATIQIFDCNTGLPIKTLQSPVYAQTNVLRNPKTGETVTVDYPVADYEKGMMTNYHTPVSISDQGVLAGAKPVVGPSGHGWYVGLWTENGAESGRLVQLEGENRDFSAITALDFARGGQTLAVAHTDGAIEIWNMMRHVRTQFFKASIKSLSGIKLSPDGSSAVLYGEVGTPELLHVASGETEDLPNITSASWTADGSTLLLGHAGSITVKDMLRGGPDREMSVGLIDPMRLISLLPGGQAVVAVGDGFLLCDLQTLSVHAILSTPFEKSYPVALEPGNRDHLLVPDGSVLRRWDLKSGSLLPGNWKASGEIQSMTPSSDGTWILVQSHDPEASDQKSIPEAYTASSDTPFWSVEVESAGSASISPDGTHVAVLLARKQIVIFDVKDPSKFSRITVADSAISMAPSTDLASVIYSISFLDSNTIAGVGKMQPNYLKNIETRTISFGGQNVLQMWDIASGQRSSSTPVQENVLVSNIVASPSAGKLAFFFVEGGIVHLWNKSSGKEQAPVVHAAITLAFNAAGTLFVTGDRFGKLVLSNAVTGEQIKQIKAGTGEIEHLCFGSDETTLIVSGEDGIQLRDFPSLDLRATFFFSHDRSLTISADNFYAASRGIFDFVSFRLDNRVYAVDQFDLLYNRPDKVLTVLGNKDQALIAAYSALHDRRIAQMSHGAEPAKPTSIPDIVISQRLPPSTQNRALDISFEASDKSSAIQSVAVVDNGVPVPGSVRTVAGALGTLAYSAIATVPLVAGVNHLQVSAFNQAGTESLRQNFEVVLEQKAPLQRHVVIVSIGVTNYQDGRYSLTYPAKDAGDFGALASTLWKDELAQAPLVLQDGTASYENILKLKETVLSKTNPDDEVIVLISGHGLIHDNTYYFAPYDMTFDNPSSKGLSFEQLSALFENIPARKKLLLLDTCDSGEIDQDTSSQAKAVRRIVEKSRGIEVSASQSSETKMIPLGEVFLDLRRGNGTLAIGASAAFQSAQEKSTLRNGLFTFALLKGLSRNESGHMLADANGDDRVSFTELRDYLESTVTKLSNGSQTPAMRVGSDEFEFIVYSSPHPVVPFKAILKEHQ